MFFPIASAITPANKSGVWEIGNRPDTAGIALNEEEHPKRTTLRASHLLWLAGRAGSSVGALMPSTQQGEVGMGPILGISPRQKKYGATATEEARAAALETGLQEYLGWVDDGRRRT